MELTQNFHCVMEKWTPSVNIVMCVTANDSHTPCRRLPSDLSELDVSNQSQANVLVITDVTLKSLSMQYLPTTPSPPPGLGCLL